jgi:hypothetical protein
MPASRSLLLLALAFPLMLGMDDADGCQRSTLFSRTPAPLMTGDWDIAYDDAMEVEVTVGGATYLTTVPTEGGEVTIAHAGTDFTFDLDCSRPAVVCPSEAWPTQVRAENRQVETFPNRVWVTLPRQSCTGQTRMPEADECGEGTLNPDCERICEGEILTEERDTFGLIDEEGDSFDLLLGAGVASNGVNCALLGVSSAHADLVTTGAAATDDWMVEEMASGEVVVAYAGGCLWAGDPDMDDELEALVLGASVRFTTGFTGLRVE